MGIPVDRVCSEREKLAFRGCLVRRLPPRPPTAWVSLLDSLTKATLQNV